MSAAAALRSSTTILSDLFHAGDGWIPYAPVGWLGLAGLGLVVWRWRWAGAAALGAVALYAGLVALNGLPVGYQFPGRILLAAIALVAVPLALCLEHVPVARVAFVPLFALSLAITAVAVLDHMNAYAESGARGDARLPIVRDLEGAFPNPRPRVAPSAPRLPDWPRSLLWVAGTVLAGGYFVQVAARRPR